MNFFMESESAREAERYIESEGSAYHKCLNDGKTFDDNFGECSRSLPARLESRRLADVGKVH